MRLTYDQLQEIHLVNNLSKLCLGHILSKSVETRHFESHMLPWVDNDKKQSYVID